MSLTPAMAELKVAALAATPGPWHWKRDATGQSFKLAMLYAESGRRICDFGHADNHDPAEGTEPNAGDMAFMGAASPEVILALFAQLEESQRAYGCAVDSVAQLQDEVFAVRAQLEAQAAPSVPVQTGAVYRANAGPSPGDYPMDRAIAALPFPIFDLTTHAPAHYSNTASMSVASPPDSTGGAEKDKDSVIAYLMGELREIGSSDPIENALDSQWAGRIARFAVASVETSTIPAAQPVQAAPDGWVIERLSETKLKVSLAGDVTAIVKESDFGTNIPAYALYGLASDLLAAVLPPEPPQ